jgi:hypothetical protein
LIAMPTSPSAECRSSASHARGASLTNFTRHSPPSTHGPVSFTSQCSVFGYPITWPESAAIAANSTKAGLT